MTLHIIGTDELREVRRAIEQQRADAYAGLLRANNLEALHYLRGYITAFDWVIAEFEKPQPQEAA